MKTFPTMLTLLRESQTVPVTQLAQPSQVLHHGGSGGADGSVNLDLLRPEDRFNTTMGVAEQIRSLLPPGSATRFLGAGAFGNVYEYKPDHGPLFAFKISSDERPESYAAVARSKQTAEPEIARHLPLLHGAWQIGSSVILACMELLEPIPPNFFRMIDAAVRALELPRYNLLGDDGKNPPAAVGLGMQAFYSAMWELDRTIGVGDLHAKNIMIRPSDKALVVADIGCFA